MSHCSKQKYTTMQCMNCIACVLPDSKSTLLIVWRVSPRLYTVPLYGFLIKLLTKLRIALIFNVLTQLGKTPGDKTELTISFCKSNSPMIASLNGDRLPVSVVLGEIKISPMHQVHYKSCLLLSFLSLNLSQQSK